ncbi:MAG: hypothetical protein IPN76_05790 [Saprospiraceae bacterium]|nr:hypothetical protein [Saprospiraceae bacterium]
MQFQIHHWRLTWLSGGKRTKQLLIFKISDNVSIDFATPTVRIYDSLEDLTNKDALFNSLSNSEKKRLLKEENIQKQLGAYLSPYRIK